MNAHPGDRAVLEEAAGLQRAVRALLAADPNPFVDPAALLRGQTLTTDTGLRYAVHEVALREGTLSLVVVPLQAQRLTITVLPAPATSAEPADLRPPSPADVAHRVRPSTVARPQQGRRTLASLTVTWSPDGWQAHCAEHGPLGRWHDRSVARRCGLEHIDEAHELPGPDAGQPVDGL